MCRRKTVDASAYSRANLFEKKLPLRGDTENHTYFSIKTRILTSRVDYLSPQRWYEDDLVINIQVSCVCSALYSFTPIGSVIDVSDWLSRGESY